MPPTLATEPPAQGSPLLDAGLPQGELEKGLAALPLDFELEARDNDIELEFDGLRVYVDPISARYLDGTQIDYVAGIYYFTESNQQITENAVLSPLGTNRFFNSTATTKISTRSLHDALTLSKLPATATPSA